jgi:hypothetical protein
MDLVMFVIGIALGALVLFGDQRLRLHDRLSTD